MIVYVSSYLVLLSFCFIYLSFERENPILLTEKFLFIIGLVPALIFIALRGNVGTDTGNYLNMVQEIASNEGLGPGDFDIEIGFYLLLKGLVLLFSEPRFVVNSISVFVALYCFHLFSKNIESFLIFSLLIFPVFFFDMTMNGLRYGLAFLLAKHASDEYLLGNKLKSFFLLVICIGFQLSGVLVFFLLRKNRFKILNLLYVTLFAIILYLIFQERFSYKFIAYTELESPSVTSGLLPLLVFLACWLNLLLVDSKFNLKFLPLLALEVASFVLARFSYAGIRFQLLILYVFFCFISGINLNVYRRKNYILVISLFFLIGLIGFVGTLKHYTDDIGIPPSPFLPYHFFWESE
jgi:hypothetical protein